MRLKNPFSPLQAHQLNRILIDPMYIKNNLFLPYQFAGGQALLGDTVYFSFIERNYDKTNSRCALFGLNLENGESKIHRAPFHFSTKKHIRFELHGIQDGYLVMSTGANNHCDTQYKFFRFDFRQWHELNPRPRRKSSFDWAQQKKFKPVKQDTALDLGAYVLSGGALASHGRRLKFVVENSDGSDKKLIQDASQSDIVRSKLAHFLEQHELPECLPVGHRFRDPANLHNIAVIETATDLLFKMQSYEEDRDVEIMQIRKAA
jgi:hypothetical protein